MVGIIDINTSSIKCKLVGFITLIFFDLSLSTFIEYNFRSSLVVETTIDHIVMIIVQIAFRMILLVWFILLLWSTFPFKYGMIKHLVKFFKWTFIVILVDLLIHCGERVVRVVSLALQQVESYLS